MGCCAHVIFCEHRVLVVPFHHLDLLFRALWSRLSDELKGEGDAKDEKDKDKEREANQKPEPMSPFRNKR